jgi:excinuclease ABC subunit C
VLKVFSDLGITDQDICALAKKEEIIYLPFRNEGLKLDDRNQGLRLLEMVRDEAHRFAVNFQRRKRSFVK